MGDETYEDGVMYCPECSAMNAKIMVKRKGWCQNCRADWPDDKMPDEDLETLREKYA